LDGEAISIKGSEIGSEDKDSKRFSVTLDFKSKMFVGKKHELNGIVIIMTFISKKQHFSMTNLEATKMKIDKTQQSDVVMKVGQQLTS